jgi:hypothetical protein
MVENERVKLIDEFGMGAPLGSATRYTCIICSNFMIFLHPARPSPHHRAEIQASDLGRLPCLLMLSKSENFSDPKLEYIFTCHQSRDVDSGLSW